MDILLIALIAVAVFFIASKLNQKTGLAYAISYIILGIITGIVIKNMGYSGINEFLPHIDMYSNTLLLLMFFAAGFSINTTAIAKSGSTIPKLSFIPAICETIVVTCVMYFLVKYLGGAINIKLDIFETMLIAGILALSSTANVVPVCLELIQGNYKSKNNIQNTMVPVSITDGFSTVPIVLLALYLAIEKSNGKAFTGSTIVMITVGVLIVLIVACILGYFLGRLVNLILKPILENLANDSQNKSKAIIITLVVFLVSYLIIAGLGLIPKIGSVISSVSILIICAIGTGISHYDKTGGSKIVSVTGNKIFAIFGTPIIFFSVGTKLDLKTLLNPHMLIIGLVTCVVAILVKGSVGSALLNKDTYTKEEKKFVFACFIPKGLALVNFSVIFATLSIRYNAENIVNFMIMLAGITIIVSIPLGVTILSNAKDKWFTK